MAIEMAKEIAPQLAKDMLLEMAKQRRVTKAQEENSRGAANPEESEPVDINNLEAADVGKTSESNEAVTIDNVNSSSDNGDPITGGNPITFECPYCGKATKSKAGLVAHERNCKNRPAEKENINN